MIGGGCLLTRLTINAKSIKDSERLRFKSIRHEEILDYKQVDEEHIIILYANTV
jgi:hypothetical protein